MQAWYLQERVFSCRMLHFGGNQMHWECFEGTLSESDSWNSKTDNSNILDSTVAFRSKSLSASLFGKKAEQRDSEPDHGPYSNW
jgi:hypothetical protein